MDLAKIFDEYYDRIYGFTLLRIRNTHDAEDLTSDVFLKVAQNIDKFDETKASLSTWLHTIALNVIRDHCRKRGLTSVDLEVAGDVKADDNVEESVEQTEMSGERSKALADALAKLDERQREIVLLRYQSNMSNKQIAETLDISESNVETILYRARKKLKNLLEKCEVFKEGAYNFM